VTSSRRRWFRQAQVSLDLPVNGQKIRGSRVGGSPSLAAQPGTQAEGSQPPRRAAQPTCDFCESALTRGERHRLVWERSLATGLVLADLCSHCSTRVESLVELYGGRGRNAIRLAQQVRPSAPAHKVAGFIARGALYLLIAFTFFLIVTLISSRVR
jgi:hypothetical protein